MDVAGKRVAMRGVVAWSVLGGLEIRGGETVPVYSVGMKFHGAFTEDGQSLLAAADPVAVEQRVAGVRFHLDGQASIAHPLRYKVRVISMHGMLIEIDHPMKVDEVLPLEISLEEEAHPLPGAGRVVPGAAARACRSATTSASSSSRIRTRTTRAWPGSSRRSPEGASAEAGPRSSRRAHPRPARGGRRHLRGLHGVGRGPARALPVALVEAGDFGSGDARATA